MVFVSGWPFSGVQEGSKTLFFALIFGFLDIQKERREEGDSKKRGESNRKEGSFWSLVARQGKFFFLVFLSGGE